MTRKEISTLLIKLLVIILPQATHAQEKAGSAEDIATAITTIRDSYASMHGVKMEMSYYYSNESTPNKYLDSMKGKLWLDGASYRMEMDSVEMLGNARYSVAVFRQDRLIYLNKPSASAATYNPVSMLDSLLSPKRGGKASVEQSGRFRIIRISMPNGSTWKSVAMTVDTATGYLTGYRMVVRTALLAPAADMASLEGQGYDTYAIVEARYTGIKQDSVPANFFDEGNFFVRKGKEYNVTTKYEGYRIFLGSPNL